MFNVPFIFRKKREKKNVFVHLPFGAANCYSLTSFTYTFYGLSEYINITIECKHLVLENLVPKHNLVCLVFNLMCF